MDNEIAAHCPPPDEKAICPKPLGPPRGAGLIDLDMLAAAMLAFGNRQIPDSECPSDF